MIPQNTKTIAVDFDGTIVEDKYPGIGKPLMFAFETLELLQKDGHRLILWTYRHGQELDDAVEFCESKGIVFYAVNSGDVFLRFYTYIYSRMIYFFSKIVFEVKCGVI